MSLSLGRAHREVLMKGGENDEIYMDSRRSKNER
jgi:hypothetical protein